MSEKERSYVVTVDGVEFSVKVNGAVNAARVSVGGTDLVEADLFTQGPVHQYSLLLENRSYEGLVEPSETGLRVWVDGEPFEVAVLEQWMKALGGARLHGAAGSALVAMTSPMPGMVVGVAVQPGDQVKKGQPLITLEAMKMRNDLKSPRDGVIGKVVVIAGQTVAKGGLLLEFA